MIKIEFTKPEQRFLSFVFMEVFGGGSTRAIQSILGEPHVAAAKILGENVDQQAKSEADYIELSEPQWRVMYESLNAVIYGLGPCELQTCTGQYLHDACNLNMRICAHVWGAFEGKYQWAESISQRRDSSRNPDRDQN